MINKLVSSNAVIAKIISDLNLKENDLRISDVRQWLAEGVEKIGAVTQLEHKVCQVPIIGYQAKLPCDLDKLDQVAFSIDGSHFIATKRATGSFGVQQCKNAHAGCNTQMYIHTQDLVPLVKSLYNLTTDEDAYEMINSNPNIEATLKPLINQYDIPSNNGVIPTNQVLYSIKPGFIYTNMPTGILKISYYGQYLDTDGMPMIPDAASYFEALYWYVTVKLKYPEYLNGRMAQHVYYDMRRSWNFYRSQAYAELMMPTVDELESIKDDWTRLMPNINEHQNFFQTMGVPENIHI